ncbi:hypothetical protein MPSEU_000150100 [Mayamaea pseudoterrestris]|nr:hypothetical protein MPSEU_000150100 [Mayamaea pseudoterrestris]
MADEKLPSLPAAAVAEPASHDDSSTSASAAHHKPPIDHAKQKYELKEKSTYGNVYFAVGAVDGFKCAIKKIRVNKKSANSDKD